MIGVLLRVHDRMADLAVCVDLIRKYWNRDRYHLVVVSNGRPAGHRLPESVRAAADRCVELERNSGHLQGNAQLVQAGLGHIPAECRYTVLLEADTWVFSDALVQKYVRRLAAANAVWASAEWIEKRWSLGLDFAVVETAYLQGNPQTFNYTTDAESWVCHRLRAEGRRFIYITENMPVHQPKCLKFFGQRHGGRFRSFPRAGMVTHHLEDLPHGLETKQYLANVCLGRREFPLGDEPTIRREHRRLRMLMTLAACVPRSRWYRSKQRGVPADAPSLRTAGQ
ncbi:hypothetical protein [Opitutus sp. GAS368]|uniref:hypothetical protein n=1 Tax=Opitutus sp. GAS368 TaxID=1882749 RepID=UPI0012FDAEA0|nr:hypothetical protein [Opitutus sp. GAS368]